MARLPKMLQVWWTKQVSHFCGTNRQVSRFDSTVNNVCPSCGRRDESVSHITRCSDDGRVAMLAYSVGELTSWLCKCRTHSALVRMLEKYLLGQDQLTMADCCTDPLFAELARVHDLLGWDNFLEGRISKGYLDAHRLTGRGDPSYYDVINWGKGLVERLVRITHKQWLFRNCHVHFKKLEGLSPAQHDDIFERVVSLMDTDPSDLLPCHQHLLEIDFEQMGFGSSTDRGYWVKAMESALSAADVVAEGRKTVDIHRVRMQRRQYQYGVVPRRRARLRKRAMGSVVYHGFQHGELV